MNETIKVVSRAEKPGKPLSSVKKFGVETAKKALAFHQSFPEYRVTPLAELKDLAAELGVENIYVKDESFRFGLNAFKVLGGSYSIGRYLAKRLGIGEEELSYELLTGEKVRRQLGDLTFVTATDGNHGRGVAWTAARLGFKSVVYMPKGSAEERLQNIRSLGAEASITDRNYDDTVRLAKEQADQKGWVMVQDTSWEGYEEIPGWIMEGYTTMACEAAAQLGSQKPTHIFLQAGVGAMAGAVAGFFTDYYGKEERPVIVTVEPDQADCIFRTARADDGNMHPVTGDLATIMAGLACGEPCPLGWEILRDHGDFYVSMPDRIAAQGMRILGNPAGGDPRVISGESGAASMGLVTEILRRKELGRMKERLKLDQNSRILCFSTEGDTDRENYRKILWDGAYSGL